MPHRASMLTTVGVGDATVSEQRSLPPKFDEGTSAISISTLADPDILVALRTVVEDIFSGAPTHYSTMAAESYWKLVKEAGAEVNRIGFARRIANDRRAELAQILQSGRIFIQPNLFLRATRPHVCGIQESVGWHRESFYDEGLTHSVNLWMPVANVTPENTLRYISNSQAIPNDAIQTTSIPDPNVKRFSDGHIIGLPYAPKHIVGGIDLSNSKALSALDNQVAIFSAQLIHGGATNQSEKIRFSVDFRAIAAANVTKQRARFDGDSFKPFWEELLA